MTRPTQVNCCSHRQFREAKDADRLPPKTEMQPVALRNAEHADTYGCRWRGRTNSFVSLDLDMVNLTSRTKGRPLRNGLRELPVLPVSSKNLIEAQLYESFVVGFHEGMVIRGRSLRKKGA
jgi:hypothetical protein